MSRNTKCTQDDNSKCLVCIEESTGYGVYRPWTRKYGCSTCIGGVITNKTKPCHTCIETGNGRFQWKPKEDNECSVCKQDGQDEKWVNKCDNKSNRDENVPRFECKKIGGAYDCVPICYYIDSSSNFVEGCDPATCKGCKCLDNRCKNIGCEQNLCTNTNYSCYPPIDDESKGQCICSLLPYGEQPISNLDKVCPEDKPTVIPTVNILTKTAGCECACIVKPEDCIVDGAFSENLRFNANKCRCEHPCADPNDPLENRCRPVNCETCEQGTCESVCDDSQECDGKGNCYDKPAVFGISFIP